MLFRPILTGMLALALLSGAPAIAEDRDGLLTRLKLPGIFGSEERAPVHLAQVGDPRITALEEQVRTLSGRIEELNFQILQMQDQILKMQEDNEFRFQELEEKKSDAGASTGQAAAAGGNPGASTPQPPVAAGPETPGTDLPRTFGTITFDQSGNIIDDSVAGDAAAGTASGRGPVAAPPEVPAGADGTIVSALPRSDDPEEIYRNSYEFILSGDYRTAETGFRDHVTRFPADPRTADARYWLGEALLGQQKYRDAAETFLAASKEYPSARKAPDMLLKLGVSLVGLDQHDMACATFAEIGKRYPEMSAALNGRIKQEQAIAKC